MTVIAALASVALIVLVLWDGFESMVLPRRVTRPYRLARLFYRTTWRLWRALAAYVPAGKRRESFLSVFGPLSLLGLFGLWVLALITGFAGLHWALATAPPGEDPNDFLSYLYLSGGTLFTVGFADVTPASRPGRVLAIVEAGVGFGFVAVIIGYLPALYQAFSHREVTISLLDARAGSPPSAAQFLLRLAQCSNPTSTDAFLAEWERWAAELLESHLSFPVLSYYRSQHDNQSWLAALTTMLDTCALLIVGVKGPPSHQARLTFAMARHAAVDLALLFRTPPRRDDPDRFPPEQLARMQELLSAAGLPLREGPALGERLGALRGMYEPFVATLGRHFLFALPPILPDRDRADNWQTSAWTPRTPGISGLPMADEKGDHFD
jgi:hypothetical protein